MYPKIIFKYSHVYEQNWQTWVQSYNKSPQKLTSQQLQTYIKEIEKTWKKYEKIIPQELSKITGLAWKEKKIVCYLVSDCRPFSDPLTLPAYKDKSHFIDVLTHELVHQLFMQEGNYERAEKAWQHFFNKYKNESQLTKIHIPLDAMMWHIYMKFFDEKRLNRDISKNLIFSDYKSAWQIVEKDGYENIIKEFSLRIKKQ